MSQHRRPEAQTAARWQRIETIFEQVVDLPPSQQDRCVARACGDDEDLRLEILRLLAHDRHRHPWIADLVAAVRRLSFGRRPRR